MKRVELAAVAVPIAEELMNSIRQIENYNAAIKASGNFAAVTTGQLREMAAEINKTVRSPSRVDKSLNALVTTGRVPKESLLVAGTAVAMSNKVMGKPIDETVLEFARLWSDPAKASAELNESRHYLDADSYKKILELLQRDKEAAGLLAQKLYGLAQIQRASQVESEYSTATGIAASIADLGENSANWIGRGIAGIFNSSSNSRQIEVNKNAIKYLLTKDDPDPQLIALFNSKIEALQKKIDEDSTRALDEGQRGRNAAEGIARQNSGVTKQSSQSRILTSTDGAAGNDKSLTPSPHQANLVVRPERPSQESLPTGRTRYANLPDPVSDPEKDLPMIVRKSEAANLYGARANGGTVRRDRIETGDRVRAEHYERSLNAFGLGAQARDQQEAERAIYRDYRIKREESTKQFELGAIGLGNHLDELDEIQIALEDSLKAHDRYYQELRLKQGDWLNGASEAFQNYVDSSNNVAEQTKNAFGNAFRGMEDALVSFTMTGKADFKSLANSIIADIVRIHTRAAMVSVLGGLGANSFVGGIVGAFGGNAAVARLASALPGNSLDNMLSLTGNFGAVASAKGNVFRSWGLHAHVNSVVDRPTLFPFAKGAMGLMGEAGPEGILPLKRDGQGRLGVIAQGGAAQGVEVHVHNSGAPVSARVNQSQGPDGRLRLDVMLEQIESRLAESVGAGSGFLSRAMEHRYGLRTSTAS